MVTITVLDADLNASVYIDVPHDVFAEVAHALSGLESIDMSGITEIQQYAQESGACLCTSFSRDTKGNCRECRHAWHNTRVYCGAIR